MVGGLRRDRHFHADEYGDLGTRAAGLSIGCVEVLTGCDQVTTR
jgi:hypothetical protein